MLFTLAEKLKSILQETIQPTPQVMLISGPIGTRTRVGKGTPVIEIEWLSRDWQGDITAGTPGQRYFKQRCQVSLILNDVVDYQPLTHQITALLLARQQDLMAVPAPAQTYGQYTVQEMIKNVLLQTTGRFSPSVVLSDTQRSDGDHQPTKLYWQLQVTGIYNAEFQRQANPSHKIGQVDIDVADIK